MIRTLASTIFITFLVTSAVAQPSKLSLEDFSLTLQKMEGVENLGVVVWDQRVQVVDGRQRPTLLGYKRAISGIAYPSMTKSKIPLADWIADRIATAHDKNGTSTTIINSSHKDSWGQIEQKIKSSKASQILVVKLEKLQFDGIAKFSYMAELDLEIYSNNGDLLHSEHVSDERVMGGVGGWKKKFPFHLVSILQDALNEPSVVDGFKTQPTTETAEKKSEGGDLIITKKGDEIEAKVEEITTEIIKYRKASQTDGPLRNIPISDVFMIKYKDDTKEVFD